MRHIQYVFVKDIRDSEGNVVKGCLPSENLTVNQDNIGNQDNVRDSEGTLEKGCLSSEDPAVNQNNIRDSEENIEKGCGSSGSDIDSSDDDTVEEKRPHR